MTKAVPNAQEQSAGFKAELLALIPFLRAFARSLCGNADGADDLAQEALVRAWRARASFAAGTNLKAWLFTILRNQFYSERRRAWRRVPWDQQAAEQLEDGETNAESELELSDTVRALGTLTSEQREALILVGAGGFSYEEAAKICNCPVGTLKSRANRARRNLIETLDRFDACLPSHRPSKGEAARDILAQLNRLAPVVAGSPSCGRKRSTS